MLLRITILIALLCPTAQAAASPWHTELRGAATEELGTGPRVVGAAGDGVRYVALEGRDGRTRVLDDRGPGVRALSTPECAYGVPPHVLVGGGNLLWQCGYDAGSIHAWVFDLAAARRFVPRGLDLLNRRQDPGGAVMSYVFVEVGRHWLHALGQGYRTTDEPIVGVRFAGIDSGTLTHPLFDGDVVAAVDTRQGWVHACPGLPRSTTIDDGQPRVYPVVYRPPFCDRDRPARPQGVPVARCPAAPRIAGLSVPVEDPQVGAGIITWQRRGVAHVASVTTGAARTLPVPEGTVEVLHTARRLYALTDDGRLLSRPLP